jgi:hypothetical protein
VSLKNTENSPPAVFGWIADNNDATGLVIAAEKRGFWDKSAVNNVEPDRGKPEIKCNGDIFIRE